MADEEQQQGDDEKEGDDEEKENGKKDDEKKDDDKKDEEKPKRAPRWPFAVAAVALVVFVGIVLAVELVPSPDVWTDDAYVQVHYAMVSPRISGQVTAVFADDNDTVPAGRLLVQLDDRDQKTAVASAQAMLARDQAQFADALANVGRQPSLIAQQDQQVSATDAQLALARANAVRYRNLASTGAGTLQNKQQADAELAQLQAQLRGAQASSDAARHQLDVLHAQSQAAEAAIGGDRARLHQAELDLSYTRIPAPLDGMVTERSVQVGDNVTAGTTLMALVPLGRLYITANYRELALRNVLPGQHVRIHVDAYNIDLDGVVQGVPPSTGALFSAVPPDNATGNFTKIVQRLPVKILVSPGQPLARLLRAGLSVETTIHTHLADVRASQLHSNVPVTSE